MRRMRKRKKKRLFNIYIFISILAISAAVLLKRPGWSYALPTAIPSVPGASVAAPDAALSSKITTLTEDKDVEALYTEADIKFLQTGNELILVNANYHLDYMSEIEIVSAYKTVSLFRADIMLNQKMLDALSGLFKSAAQSGYDNLFVNSGYRTSDEQGELYENAEDKAYVLKPGESEHQTGLAADIAVKGMSGEKMGDSREGRWLAENAWKYGLILRYPKDKSDITGVAYEPWHFRYVGLPHAYFCYINDLCLEEYITYLKEHGGYSVTIEETKYQVFYQTPVNDIIQLPVNTDREISADNTGGYIITVKTEGD